MFWTVMEFLLPTMTNAVLTCGFAVTLMYSEVTSDRIKTPSAQNNRKGGRQRGPGHQEGTQGHSPNRCCVGVSTTSSDVRKPEDGDRVLEFLTSIQWALWP